MDQALRKVGSSVDMQRALSSKIAGNCVEISGGSELDRPGANALCYSIGAADRRIRVVTLIAALASSADLIIRGCVLLCENPRLGFTGSLEWIEADVGFGRDGTALQIDSTAQIGRHCAVGSGAFIGADPRIGNSAATAAPTKLDAHCVIKSEAFTGEDGFGFARVEDGLPDGSLYLGDVQIGDHVEIGGRPIICSGHARPSLKITRRSMAGSTERATLSSDLVQW